MLDLKRRASGGPGRLAFVYEYPAFAGAAACVKRWRECSGFIVLDDIETHELLQELIALKAANQ